MIVDGLGEFAAFRARFCCGERILKTDGPRSHTTTPNQIVSHSRKQIAQLRAFGCDPIIVVTDFEGRSGSHREFVDALRSEFAAAFSGCDIRVAVPNQMIENWYLADICYLSEQRTFLRRVKKQQSYDGKHGKRLLRTLFRAGKYYNEVVHGPILFTLLRFEEAKFHSPSLAGLVEALQ